MMSDTRLSPALGWFHVDKDGLPLHDVPVLVCGKSWSSMAVAKIANGFQGIDGNKFDNQSEVMWRNMRGAPINQSVHSNPVQVWQYLPPVPIHLLQD